MKMRRTETLAKRIVLNKYFRYYINPMDLLEVLTHPTFLVRLFFGKLQNGFNNPCLFSTFTGVYINPMDLFRNSYHTFPSSFFQMNSGFINETVKDSKRSFIKGK